MNSPGPDGNGTPALLKNPRAPRAEPPVRAGSGLGPDAGWAGAGHLYRDLALLATLALAARLVYLDHNPHEDELNHVLAARSLLTDGSLRIEGGAPYTRAWAYTYLVAGLFRIFGDSLVVARMPAVMFGVALVLAVFAWIRVPAGRVGAWAAALLLAFAPISIQLSQWVRFYTLHALAIFVGATVVYQLAAGSPPSRRRAVALGASAAAAFALALHLQVVTVVALAGVLAGAVLLMTPALLARLPSRLARVGAVTGAAAALAVGALLFLRSGPGETILGHMRYVDLWAENYRNSYRFYHFILVDQYPALWTLFPFAVLAAASRAPRHTVFCASVFTVSFVAQSLAAWKTERYLFYALPMFFAIWGFAIGAAVPWLRRSAERVVRTLSPHAALPPRAVSIAAGALLGAATLFALGGSGAVSYTYKMLTVSDRDWRWHLVAPYRGDPGWRHALPILGPAAAASDVVLSSSEIRSLYFLGQVDYLLRRSNDRAGILPEFTIGSKVPVPVISTAESLRRVMSCHGSGLIVVERFHWRNPWGVPEETAEFLEAHTARLTIPEELQLLAFRWFSAVQPSPQETCARPPALQH